MIIGVIDKIETKRMMRRNKMKFYTANRFEKKLKNIDQYSEENTDKEEIINDNL